MSEQASIQALRDRAQQINEQVRERVEQANSEARELYNKAEARINELLEEYKGYDNALEAIKESSTKLQQGARDLQQQQVDRLEDLVSQVRERLGLAKSDDLEKLKKKVTSLTRKVNKLEKAAKK